MNFQQLLKMLGPMTLKWLKGKGITLAMCAAAYYLVPDHAVMSKDELAEHKELSQRELFLRKAAVVVTVLAMKGAIRTTINLGQLVKDGQKPTIMHAAQLMMAAPAFLATYKVIANRIEKGEGSMNIREYGPSKAQALGAKAIQLGGYGTLGFLVDKMLANMPKPPQQ